MRATRALPLLLLLFPLFPAIVTSAMDAVPPEKPGNPAASRMWLAGEELEQAEVVAHETMPPRFTLVLVRGMPTPGWTCTVDAVDVDAANGRIAVRLTEIAPAGIAAQVITPTRFELPLGTVGAGSYFVEVRTRREAGREHRPAHALVLEAR